MGITISKYVYAPKVSKILIDKIAIVFDTPYSIARFEQYVKENPKQSFRSSLYHVGIRLPGAEAYQFDTSHQTTITLEVGPKGKNHSTRQCRLEFNPAKVPAAYVSTMLHNEFSIEYEKHILSGMVTKIDLAVDVQDAPINMLLFRAKKYSVTKNEYGSGRTLYIGGSFSGAQFKIYDKATQMKKIKKKTNNPTLHEEIPKNVLTRIELSKKAKMPVSEIHNLENPFGKLQVLYVGKLKTAQSNDLRQVFLHAARAIGIYPAFMNLSQAGKAEINEFLKLGNAEWWSPKSIWGSYLAALQPILHPHGICN